MNVERIACEHIGRRSGVPAAVEPGTRIDGRVIERHRVVRGRAVIIAAGDNGVYRASGNRDEVAGGGAAAREAAVDMVEHGAGIDKDGVTCGIAGSGMAAFRAAIERAALHMNAVAGSGARFRASADGSAADRAAFHGDIVS